MAQKHNNYEEKPMTRYGTVQSPSRRYRRLRHPTFEASVWADKNPLLQRGEIGYEVDTHKVKVGDGVTYWNDLPYSGASVSWGNITGDIDDQTDLKNALDAKANTADLGSAAYTDSTDYATAAQGALADSALQPGDNVSELVNDAGYLTQHQTLADLGITATASEINVLDGITASTAELNYTDGVTSNIQTQLDNKVTRTTFARQVYATNGSGVDSPVEFASSATGSTIVLRTGTGQVAAADPTANSHAATKKYVDDGLATKQATISDLATIRSGAAAGATAVQPGDLATVATSGNYNDLSNKPTIPTVNNATLTIQKNGTTVQTFTANQSTNATADISVPTDTNDLTNGAGYITGITSSDVTTALGYTPYSSANPSGYTSNVGTVTSVNNTSPDGAGNVSLTIPTVNDATISVTQNGVSVGSFTLNQASGDTIALTDTTYSVMTGASAGDAGASGLVPAPAAGDQQKFLQGDGTWANPTAATAWGNITGTLSDQTDLDNALKALVPAGTVIPFAGASAPTGYLKCDGSAVSRTTYADLFAAIGTTYGTGDGSTTFNLPNFTNRVIQGGTVGSYKSAGLPNISGNLDLGDGRPLILRNANGCFYNIGNGNIWSAGSYWQSTGARPGFSAQKSNSIYGASTTVQPPALCVTVCIKY